jgi:hypothetical protein
MLIRKFQGVALLFFLAVAGAAAAEDADINLSLRFFDKQVYTPESDVSLKVAISNNGSLPYRFRLSDNRTLSFWFDVRTMTNNPLPESEIYKSFRAASSPALYREVLIESGEEYSLVLNLKDFVGIENPGVYTVRCLFYPFINTVRGDTSPSLESPPLILSVRPSTAGLAAVQDKIDRETGEILKAQPLSPDEVVKYTIQARQHGEWNKFFLYLDLESLYQRSGSNAQAFKRLSQTEREAAIERYKRQLRDSATDEEINTIPTSFEIQKTTYTQQQGTVEVRATFAIKGGNTLYREVKRYTYFLNRKDSVWKIYNYSVQNLGTEKAD